MLTLWLLTVSLALAALLAAALYLWRQRTAARRSDQHATVEVLSEEEEQRQALERLAPRRRGPG